MIANGGADGGYHGFGKFLIGSCALEVFNGLMGVKYKRRHTLYLHIEKEAQ